MASRRHKKKKKEGTIAGLLGSVAAPLIGEIAKPIFKKIVGRRRSRRQ